MGCMTGLFGIILPRFVLLVAWSNAQDYWGSLFGSQIWLGLGWLFLPWTTLIYGLFQSNGLTVLNIVFLVMAVLLDLGTWGVGVFAGRKQVSSYRDA